MEPQPYKALKAILGKRLVVFEAWAGFALRCKVYRCQTKIAAQFKDNESLKIVGPRRLEDVINNETSWKSFVEQYIKV